MALEIIAILARITGMVQGVWFRGWVREEARRAAEGERVAGRELQRQAREAQDRYRELARVELRDRHESGALAEFEQARQAFREAAAVQREEARRQREEILLLREQMRGADGSV